MVTYAYSFAQLLNYCVLHIARMDPQNFTCWMLYMQKENEREKVIVHAQYI